MITLIATISCLLAGEFQPPGPVPERDVRALQAREFETPTPCRGTSCVEVPRRPIEPIDIGALPHLDGYRFYSLFASTAIDAKPTVYFFDPDDRLHELTIETFNDTLETKSVRVTSERDARNIAIGYWRLVQVGRFGFHRFPDLDNLEAMDLSDPAMADAVHRHRVSPPNVQQIAGGYRLRIFGWDRTRTLRRVDIVVEEGSARIRSSEVTVLVTVP